jgi:hypothetical protein
LVSPLTVAVSCREPPTTTEVEGALITIFGPCVTVSAALPDIEESSTDVAIMETLPAADGVKSPVELMLPAEVGLMDQLTALE